MNPSAIDTNRLVARWLLVCCALVFAMVILGGVTRLTGSGLSMVDWRPLTGILPPLTDEAWQRTFEMYQESPEFQKKNAYMNVDDFKGIFWLEYLHRLLGRMIGMVFLLPFLFFVWKGYIEDNQAGPVFSDQFRYIVAIIGFTRQFHITGFGECVPESPSEQGMVVNHQYADWLSSGCEGIH